MSSDRIPEGIITRFRTLSLERVSKIEATWNTLIQGVVDESAVKEMSRELHTLKGDAKIVGFDDVHVLAHKLEELLGLAAQLRYAVSEDLELVVTMALQFLNMLLRKKGMSGIDLTGFIRQVDEVLREARTLPVAARVISVKGQGRTETTIDRLSEATRQRLAVAATTTFLEYLSARGGTSRTRLRGVWQTLRQELAHVHAVSLSRVLDRHAAAAKELAGELGKPLGLEVDLGDLYVEPRVAEALDVAVLHLVRNAVDHGIEAPEARRRAGKDERGTIRIHATEAAGMIELVISDDGGGIDVAHVGARAVEHGLLDPSAAASATARELLDLLFQPGFTTRREVSDISGRGVGLDAVKAAVLRIGGTVDLASTVGAGTTFTLRIPAPVRQVTAHRFLAPGGGIALAVSARWTASLDPSRLATAIDPLTAIQLIATSRQTSVGLARAPEDLALRFRWGFLDIALRAASAPELVTGERICPTPDDYPIEIISIGGQDTLLLRPEHMANLDGRTASA
jgi:two-component system chemotaxis sensor kinase CheA